MRTDPNRFKDLNYVQALVRTWLGLTPYAMTPAQQQQLNQEMLAFGEYYRGVLDILMNLVQIGISKAEVMNYFSVVVKTGGSPGSIRMILEYTFELTARGKLGKEFISVVSKNATSIGEKLASLKQGSGRVLGFLIALQVGIHLLKGDWAKAVGEIAKAVLCTASAPAALLDLIDSLIGYLLPAEWLKWPPIRVIRGMNPAQCTSLIVENLTMLAYVFAMAKQRNWKAVEAAIAKMCKSFEDSPASIFTVLSRDTALLLDEYVLPNWISRGEICGASIRNLADYARANPTQY